MTTTATFANWAGNQTCTPARRASPSSEAEVQAVVREAVAAGQGVRVVATGHSFTAIHLTDGTLIDLANLHGARGIDAARRRVTALPGTTVGELGDPLWDAGLAFPNQGDIDTQGISGAIGTATHGSGIRLKSLSAGLRRARFVTGSGEVVEIGEDRPDYLRAAQVAVGMLGVMTEMEIEVAPAYRMRESIEQWRWEETLSRWDEMVAGHRHFSFFWLPTADSAALYNLVPASGISPADTCYVKIYDGVGPEVPDDPTADHRVDRAYRIYPGIFDPNFYELEYFVPFDRSKEALAAMRELMLNRLPASVFPLEVRTVAADDALLSPNYGRPSTVISVSGVPGTIYEPYLREVDALLGTFDARVHWGKLHFLTREQLAARYPESDAFIRIRRELDPNGIFLNDHLRPLFGPATLRRERPTAP